MKEVHALDRRDLLIWGTNISDPAFLDEYSKEREFWLANGKKKGALPEWLIYQLAKKYPSVRPDPMAAQFAASGMDLPEAEQEKRSPGRPRKELQPA